MTSKSLASTVVGMAILLVLPGLAWSDNGKTYRVTITNLTAGQPFSPPVLVTHTDKARIFAVGEISSAEIRAIAENGNNEPLLAALHNNVEVHDVVAGNAPLVPANNPGGTMFASKATYEITTRGKARYLSIANMLICTNDGFTGLDSVRLPSREATLYSVAYDARSEANTENFADLVPPCQGLIGIGSEEGTFMSNPLLAEEGIVIPHVGILGGVDLVQDVHAWGDPVARIEIERVRGGKKDD